MQDVLDELRQNLSCPTELGGILIRALDEGLLARHLNRVARGLVNGDETRLGLMNARSIVVAQCDQYILHLRRIGRAGDRLDAPDPSGCFVHTPGSNCVCVVRAQVPVTVHRYRLPSGLQRDVFAAGVLLEKLESEEYTGGPVFETPEDDVIRDFDCAGGEGWMLRLTYEPFAVESWFFDKQTLRSVFPSAVMPETSSLIMLCQIFGASGDTAAEPLVRELAKHDAYFVRWAAVQAMGRIDGDAARELLLESARDPHPHIQAAARKTLERIGA